MIRIIVVDDEILARLGIRTFLETQNDFRIEEDFGSSKDCMEWLRNNGGTDIVITDIEMSDMNGIELIRTLQSEHLSAGVVIVSCHEDFRYAKEAMAAGAGAYLLKQEITEELLVSTVRDVYKRSSEKTFPEEGNRSLEISVERRPMEECMYAVGIIELHRNGVQDKNSNFVNESMMQHLLENIVRRHDIGTIFKPYRNDLFVLFQFSMEESHGQCRKRIEDFAGDLLDNLQMYINRQVILGVSDFFYNTERIREEYDNAMEAASLSFYREKKICCFYEDMTNKALPDLKFTSDGFLDEGGYHQFCSELEIFLDQCRIQQQPAGFVKEVLEIQAAQMIWRVLQEYNFPESLQQKWNGSLRFADLISRAEDLDQLKNALEQEVDSFRLELLSSLKQDELTGVIQYVNEHLDEDFSLQDLAGMSYMSTTTFCKKFKEKTGMTMVQYVNCQKVVEVKRLLHMNLTLEEIADRAGFHNVNYMIRVFRKLDGRTVTEYRQACLEEKASEQ
ncbi:MAG: response regulator [Oribacterium sp.]|nr:response regulator [Oribacterium sp.]